MKVFKALLCTFLVFVVLFMTFPALVGSNSKRDLDELVSVDIFGVYHSFVDVVNSLGSAGSWVVNELVVKPVGTLGIIIRGPQGDETITEWFGRAWINYFSEYSDMELHSPEGHGGGGFSF